MQDFSKRDKKAARAIFELALQREFSKGLNDFYNILHQWKQQRPEDNRDAYHAIFNAVKKFDKHIAQRYDGLSGGRYFITVIGLLVDGTISKSELSEFSEQAREQLSAFADSLTDHR